MDGMKPEVDTNSPELIGERRTTLSWNIVALIWSSRAASECGNVTGTPVSMTWCTSASCSGGVGVMRGEEMPRRKKKRRPTRVPMLGLDVVREVVRRVEDGESSRSIGAALGISHTTVRKIAKMRGGYFLPVLTLKLQDAVSDYRYETTL